MLQKLMRALFALLVAVAFGCMPTLALASNATASPPACDFALAPDVAPALVKSPMPAPRPPIADRAAPLISACKATPMPPLRE